jgi:hypothetical protein
VQFRAKFGATSDGKKLPKKAKIHNAKLRFFSGKNTISWGDFCLPTKAVVF